jgi:hypothetical protein
MYPCSKMLCSSQQGYSDMTSSASSNSKICCILVARVTGPLLLAKLAVLACPLLRFAPLSFSTCTSSPGMALAFPLGLCSLAEISLELPRVGGGGRNCDEDIGSAFLELDRGSFLLDIFNLGSDRSSLLSDRTLRCLGCAAFSVGASSGGAWKSFAVLSLLSLAAPSRPRYGDFLLPSSSSLSPESTSCMVPRSTCDCCPARAIMEKRDWFIDIVSLRFGAVTSSCASSPSLKRSGMSSDRPRTAVPASLRFLASLLLPLSLPLSCDAIVRMCGPSGAHA